MSDREAAIREKLRSVDVECASADDLEYASDLDFLLAELDAAREREAKLREALRGLRPLAEKVRDLTEEPGNDLHDDIFNLMADALRLTALADGEGEA